MPNSKPLQYFFLGIVALLASVKVKEKCAWCSIGLIGLFVLFFIIAGMIAYKKHKKIKRLKDKDLL